MQFREVVQDGHHIYAGAIESMNRAGYVAALIITVRGPQPRELFRDMHLSGGHVWDAPEEALDFAIERGLEMVHARRF
jgi:hypothetical protein